MLLAHLRIGNTKSNTFLHFFILINLYHAQPTTNMYNSLAFFVHKPLPFIQIAFCNFGMNHARFQLANQKVIHKKIEHPLTAFTFFVPQQNNKKKRREEKRRRQKRNKNKRRRAKQSLLVDHYYAWQKVERTYGKAKITLHSSSKKLCKVILCNVEIARCEKTKHECVDFDCRSSEVPRESMGGRQAMH